MVIERLPAQNAVNGRHFRQLAIVVVKALVSIGLIAVLATRLDYTKLVSYWGALDVSWILSALAILFVEMCAIAGVRLKLMLIYVDARRTLATTARIALSGFFFEQVTIGFVGGDAIRLWLLRRAEVAFGCAVRALLLDRACGFVSLVLLSLLGVHELLPLVDERVRSAIAGTLIVIVAGGLVGVSVAFVLAKLLPLSRWAAFWQRLGPQGQITNGVVLVAVFALAGTTHLLNVLVFWMLGESLGLSLTIGQWFIVAPTVLLVSMLPISIGGWGVREGAMLVALRGFGIPTEEALLPSILFGLCAVTATLPGGIFWISTRKPSTGREQV
jgi:uncharacterized membrane protein YbhN (UPF0104 family)